MHLILVSLNLQCVVYIGGCSKELIQSTAEQIPLTSAFWALIGHSPSASVCILLTSKSFFYILKLRQETMVCHRRASHIPGFDGNFLCSTLTPDRAVLSSQPAPHARRIRSEVHAVFSHRHLRRKGSCSVCGTLILSALRAHK